MDVYEITGFETGVDNSGVNYLSPIDSFTNIVNGFIYRQVLQSRQGVGFFAPRLAGQTRVFGIFEHTLPDSTKELLVMDQNYLYKYNTGTGVFDQIPFGGSMAAYTGFNIPAKDLYISGTSYPTATNGARFIFCGEGITPNGAGSSIFFYNGAAVLDFTSLVDNPNYAAPPGGALTSATYVLWFNERLNFIVPVIAGIAYNQGVLYSGIRTTSGNGDKFNVAGSGLFQADTYQNITGATILGQIMALNFDRMAYTLEKTKDAFNPYFGRAIPGVLGTNAKFSAVSWNDIVQSIGKTGILGTDGRQNLRTDNKIPYFTQDTIDQIDFNLTYGGFDRLNNQFLWAYKDSETDSSTQNSVLVKNYEENTWSIYDQRFSVLGQTDLGRNLTWDDIDETTGNESWAQWNTTEEIWDRIGIGQTIQKTLAGDDLGFIYELNQDFDDYFTNISAITPGATTTLTVTANGIQAGDLVTVSNVEGMVEINNFDTETNELTGNLYTVISATPTSIEINVDSTLFTPYTTGGNISKIISFSAETIPFNPYRSQGRRCYLSYVEFLIDTDGGSLLVDVFSDQEEAPFKQNVLLQPNITTQSSQWISMSVNQESNFITFVLKQQSPAVQLKLTSIRIHCEPGGLTSG
jgi:hypothetical protein